MEGQRKHARSVEVEKEEEKCVRRGTRGKEDALLSANSVIHTEALYAMSRYGLSHRALHKKKDMKEE